MKQLKITKADNEIALNAIINPNFFSLSNAQSPKEVSNDYLLLRRSFKGVGPALGSLTKIDLFTRFVYQTHERFKTSESPIVLTILQLNINNYQSIEIPRGELLSIELDLSDFTTNDLEALLSKINLIPLHHIDVQGNKNIPGNVFESFLEKLYDAQLINVVDDTYVSLAYKLTYRNQLIKLLGVRNQPNIWKAIMQKWASIFTLDTSTNDGLLETLNSLPYLKYNFKSNSFTLTGHFKDVLDGLQPLQPGFLFQEALNSCIFFMGEMFFDKMLEHFADPSFIGNYLHDIHFNLNFPLQVSFLERLTSYIRLHHYALAFTKLTLNINHKLIYENAFLDLIKALKETGIETLILVFPFEEIYDDNIRPQIENKLIEILSPHVDYPIIISNTSRPVSLTNLEKILIQNIQKKNFNALTSDTTQRIEAEDKSEVLDFTQAEKALFANKIKMKELMREQSAQAAEYDKFVKTEIHHVVQTQLIEEKIEQIEIIEEVSEQVLQTFRGKLINYETFIREPYQGIAASINNQNQIQENQESLALIQNELFMGLPQSIKYFSQEAAIQIAKNLPAFAALNAHNLPQYFILKKTTKGELVLDYDIYADERKTNVFTPKPLARYEQVKPIYDIEITDAQVKEWVNSNALIDFINLGLRIDLKKKLINLWIMFGDKGVKYFFAKIASLDAIHKGFTLFLFDKYLKYFIHWDQFLSDKKFINCLERLKSYDKNKLDCLQKFLSNAGNSYHDFSATVEAFETFWEKVESLCSQYEKDHYKGQDTILPQKRLINSINIPVPEEKMDSNLKPLSKKKVIKQSEAWFTPQGGNPIVYMERLLTILENASDLLEQINCLGGLELSNSGAYYASKYEGFKLVTKEMDFVPALMRNNIRPDGTVYRLSIDELHHMTRKRKYDLAEAEFGAKPQAEQDTFYDPKWTPLSYEEWRATIKTPWLIKNAKDDLTYDELSALITAGQAELYDYNKFRSPYKVYLEDIRGTVTLYLDERPSDFTGDYVQACAWRFMGQQINRVAFKQCIETFELSKSYSEDISAKELVLAIFFMSHNANSVKYTDHDLQFLFKSLQRMSSDENVIKTTLKNLLHLYKLDIKLNVNEGSILCQRLSMMNSSEFEGLHFDKDTYINKLFKYLRNNKYGVLKCLSTLYKLFNSTAPKIPFVYAIDTAEYLASDINIATQYKEDLLLFCLLINGDYEHLYHANRNDAVILEQLSLLKDYMRKAATTPTPNNLDYAIRTMMQSRFFTSFHIVLAVLHHVDRLNDLNFRMVNEILRDRGFQTAYTAQVDYVGDSYELKSIMIDIIMLLDNLARKESVQLSLTELIQYQSTITNDALQNELLQMDIKQLQTRFADVCNLQSTAVTIIGSRLLKPLLKKLRDALIHERFNFAPDLLIVNILKGHIAEIQDFEDYSDFEKINRINNQARTIANLLTEIIKRENFLDHSTEISNLFSYINYADYNYEMLYSLVSWVYEQPQRSYVGILNSFTALYLEKNNEKDKYLIIINYLSRLTASNLSSEKIETIIPLLNKYHNDSLLSPFILKIIESSHKSDDIFLNFILKNLSIELSDMIAIMAMREMLPENVHDSVCSLLSELHTHSKLSEFIQAFSLVPKENQISTLTIIGKSYVSGRIVNNSVEKIDYIDFMNRLNVFYTKLDNSGLLFNFFQTATLSASSLYTALQNQGDKNSFDEFMQDLEKSPFGPRDFAQQFSIAELERVVNDSKDLQNHTSFTYQRRKQLMEAVLFVNAIGEHIPLYNNKPACQLSSQEIKTLFMAVKNHKLKHLDRFQTLLYALGIMREAMYRATGELPYTTQLFALLDSIMHQGDVISNIDTGQGKSNIDTIRCGILWLVSDVVDITTSSLIDAKVQIARYASFLETLGIPYTSTPITASSEFKDYRLDGVNFSTFSALSLFFSRARAENFVFAIPTNKVSLVINESDHAILDDMTIYRYAISEGVGYGNEWIYYAINEFIESHEFKNLDYSDTQDFNSLRNFLAKKARQQGKSPRIVNKFDDKQLLAWIESAILVRYRLRENFAYVIPPDSEYKNIDGVMRHTKSIKILMKDGKVNPDTSYGNGIQQLLYAYLNQKLGLEKFVIEQQSRTITSTNNKNLIQQYLSRNGFIWGSSGTVGSDKEIEEQYSKYGFSFSKIEPHQKNIVKIHKPQIFDDEVTQFAKLIKLVKSFKKDNINNISTIFCKDIETAQRLFKQLQKDHTLSAHSMQLYIGVGDEEQVVNNARRPGMITVTTSALGRNIDILYPRILGMTVIQAYMDSVRGAGQKGGRTGREGSPGHVYFYLNKNDLAGRSLDEIAKQIEANYAEEREFNEGLYDVIGYLLSVIDSAEFTNDNKTEFFKQDWATFTETIEVGYRESKLNNTYTQDNFVRETVRLFNELLIASTHAPKQLSVDPVVLLNHLNRQKPIHSKYPVLQQAVKIKDCVPPEMIAYHFIAESTPEPEIEVNKDEIKQSLNTLLVSKMNGEFIDANKEYFAFINSHTKSLGLIREAHDECINEFLTAQIGKAKSNSFISRLFGFAPKLRDIANNQHYIIMFKVLTAINNNNAVVSTAVLKPLLITFLDQYLQDSWFINADRKRSVAVLKARIEGANTHDELLAALNETQITVLAKDIADNNSSFWRRLKPLNLSGESRLQTALTDMTLLMSALTAKDLNTTVVNNLAKELTAITNNISELNMFNEDQSFDNLQTASPRLEVADKANAKVITSNLSKIIRNNLLFSKPVVMTGRKELFQYQTQSNKL